MYCPNAQVIAKIFLSIDLSQSLNFNAQIKLKDSLSIELIHLPQTAALPVLEKILLKQIFSYQKYTLCHVPLLESAAEQWIARSKTSRQYIDILNTCKNVYNTNTQ